jgi:radical SAM protein with 4Fe4S-binding SPASM domain
MNTNVILKAPTHIELTITERCNHYCKHCYNYWRRDKGVAKDIELSKIDYILDELIKNEVSYVTITGGEPLMNTDVLFYVIEKLQKFDIGIGMNTNLTLMNDYIAERLVSVYHWENAILTSLPSLNSQKCDEITGIKGSFNNIIEGIKVCNRYGIDVGINIVVNNQNIPDKKELAEFVDRYSIAVVALTRTVPPSYDSTNPEYSFDVKKINELVEVLKYLNNKTDSRATSLCTLPLCIIDGFEELDGLSTKCGAGIVGCSVNAVTGEVMPCAHNEKSYGNIYDEDLAIIWERMSSWRNGYYIPDECKSCKLISKCGGECRLVCKRVCEENYRLRPLDSILNKNKDLELVYDIEKTYYFNKKTKIRVEEFGATISLGLNEFYVNKNVYDFILILKESEKIDKEALLNIIQINDFLINFLNQLLANCIIYEK